MIVGEPARPPSRRWPARATPAVGVLVVLVASAFFAATRTVTLLPATLAAIGLLVALREPAGSRRAATVVAGVAVVSGAVTAALVLLDRRLAPNSAGALITIGEILALLLASVAVAARAAPRLVAPAAALSVVAASTWVLRSTAADRSLTTALGATVWGFAAVGACAVGLYLRWLAVRRAETFRAARQAHRIHVAADLHDYVAHDVSEILALAQAGQIVGAANPQQAVEIFRSIEQAALHSMTSLDRTVRMLGEPEETGAEEPVLHPGLAELEDLVRRFRRAELASIELDVDPELARDLPSGTSTVIYRFVVEALTNVRRHAPTARRVRIEVHRVADIIEVSVLDDGTDDSYVAVPTRGRGGQGLAALTERITALGGTLSAGPQRPHGWRVAAALPLLPL